MGHLVGQSVSESIGWLIHRSVGHLVGRSVGQSGGWSVGGQLVGHLLDWSIGLSIP